MDTSFPLSRAHDFYANSIELLHAQNRVLLEQIHANVASIQRLINLQRMNIPKGLSTTNPVIVESTTVPSVKTNTVEGKQEAFTFEKKDSAKSTIVEGKQEAVTFQFGKKRKLVLNPSDITNPKTKTKEPE